MTCATCGRATPGPGVPIPDAPETACWQSRDIDCWRARAERMEKEKNAAVANFENLIDRADGTVAINLDRVNAERAAAVEAERARCAWWFDEYLADRVGLSDCREFIGNGAPVVHTSKPLTFAEKVALVGSDVVSASDAERWYEPALISPTPEDVAAQVAAVIASPPPPAPEQASTASTDLCECGHSREHHQKSGGCMHVDCMLSSHSFTPVTPVEHKEKRT